MCAYAGTCSPSANIIAVVATREPPQSRPTSSPTEAISHHSINNAIHRRSGQRPTATEATSATHVADTTNQRPASAIPIRTWRHASIASHSATAAAPAATNRADARRVTVPQERDESGPGQLMFGHELTSHGPLERRAEV
jgi:hypothetical protein